MNRYQGLAIALLTGAVLAVGVPAAQAAPAPPPALPIASPLENQLAANDSVGYLGDAAALAPLAGALAGAAAGGVTCLVLTLGCLPVVAVMAAGGGVLGTVFIGGPVALYSAYNYLSTVAAAPGQSKYAGKGGFGTNEAGVSPPQVHAPSIPTGSEAAF